MTDEVADAFRAIIANRRKPSVEPMIAGRTGFLFLDKNDMPMVALHWEKYFKRAVDKYNSIYRIQLPKITPHVCILKNPWHTEFKFMPNLCQTNTKI